MKSLFLAVLLAPAVVAPAITGDLRPWRYSVEEHLLRCHPQQSQFTSTGSSSFVLSSTLISTSTYHNPKPSETLQHQADDAKACEKTEQDLRDLLNK